MIIRVLLNAYSGIVHQKIDITTADFIGPFKFGPLESGYKREISRFEFSDFNVDNLFNLISSLPLQDICDKITRDFKVGDVAVKPPKIIKGGSVVATYSRAESKVLEGIEYIARYPEKDVSLFEIVIS